MAETVSETVMAELIGVTARTVRDLAQRGLVVREGRGLFRLVDSVRGYCGHLREAAAARGQGFSAGDLTAERTREARERADKLAIANARSRGELVAADAVAREWADMLGIVRSRVMATPSRVAARLGHLSPLDIAAIDRELRDALAELGEAS